MNPRTIIPAISLLYFILSLNAFTQDQDRQKTPVKPALLVIDVQNAYVNGMAEKDKEVAMTNINFYINVFRSYDCPVIRIYHFSKEFGPAQGTKEFEFPESVAINPEDAKVIKTYPDAFNKTDLDKILREKGCNTVFLCGLSAVGCVLASYIGAQNHDYKAFLVKDALMSHNSDYTNSIENMFDAITYDVIKLVLDSK